MTHQKDQMPERERREAEDVEKFRVWAETATYQAARGHWSNVWTIIAAELQPIADRYGSGGAIRASNGEHDAPVPVLIPGQQLPPLTRVDILSFLRESGMMGPGIMAEIERSFDAWHNHRAAVEAERDELLAAVLDLTSDDATRRNRGTRAAWAIQDRHHA